MAVNQYLTAAAGHLESAANALKSEMDQVRADFMTFERQATHDIHSKESDMRSFTARAISEADNATQVAYFSAQAAQLKKDIEDLKKQIETRRGQMNNEIRDKESAMNGIMSQARNLYNQAANMK
jgi:prefoldin subunit 5